jgi:hypothetical protein
MALWLVAPARMISSMIGRTLAANRLALALATALPRFATSAMLGVKTARGGVWTHVQVGAVLHPFEVAVA